MRKIQKTFENIPYVYPSFHQTRFCTYVPASTSEYFLHRLYIDLKLDQIQNCYYLKNFDRYPKICCKQGLFGWRALLMSLAQNEPLKNSKFHVCVKWMIKEENYHQQKGYLKNQFKDWWMSKVY